MAEIFVVAEYTGYGGHGAPLQAFSKREEAEAFVSALRLGASYEEWRLYAVPIWPEPATARWPDAIGDTKPAA